MVYEKTAENNIGVEVETIERKIAKSGKPYTRILTNLGWFSCFDAGVVTMLEKEQANICEVIATSDNVIKQFVQVISPKQAKSPAQAPVKPTMSTQAVSQASYKPVNKEVTMYTSYCKDLLVKMLGLTPTTEPAKLKVMQELAVETIKDIKKQFE